ncbi:MAG: glycosyltransferase family 4 protein [Patescibacteria group bacterium]
MKILIFSTAYFPFVGGAEVAVQRITDHLDDDIEFHMITVNLDGKQKPEDHDGFVKIYRLGNGKLSKYFLPWTGYKKAKELHLKNNYDAAWSIMASQASIAASLFKIFSGKKLILTLQEGDEEEHLMRYTLGNKFLYNILIKPWHRLVFKKADIVTVISEHLKKRAIDNGVEESKINVIPNAVDIQLFAQKHNKQEPEITRKTLNIKDDEKVIITVSRLVKKNGLKNLIDAVSLLNKEQKIKLIICGAGDEEKKLKDQVDKNNIKDKILFLGNIDHEKIPQYLWISDVFCRPSLSEGLGNVFLEAMVAGLPVVATSVGGIPDFLNDGATGWFCKVNNPESISEKIKYILDEKNKTEVEKVVENAKKMVVEKYNWGKITKEMEKVFKKL